MREADGEHIPDGEELGEDWEESWERPERAQGKGFSPLQWFLLFAAVLLAAALIAMGALFFFGRPV